MYRHLVVRLDNSVSWKAWQRSGWIENSTGLLGWVALVNLNLRGGLEADRVTVDMRKYSEKLRDRRSITLELVPQAND